MAFKLTKLEKVLATAVGLDIARPGTSRAAFTRAAQAAVAVIPRVAPPVARGAAGVGRAALGAGATFVSRTLDKESKHMQDIITQSYKHRGTSFIEIYQNCNIFNDGAFSSLTDRDTKSDTVLLLEDGQPMVFGAEKNKAIRLDGNVPKVFEIGDKLTIDDALVHDKKDYVIASLLANMTYNPDFPEPLGVFYAIDMPTYEDLMVDQIEDAIKKKPKGSVQQLLDSGDNWVVK